MTKAWTGQEIYENFQHGVGPEGLITSAALVKEAATAYRDLADQVHRLAAEMEAGWEGDAGERARRGAGPLLVEHETAAHHLFTAEDLAGRQAASFAEAKYRVVPVPPAPAEVAPWAMASPGRMVTFQEQVVAHQSAAQNNVDVMNGYTGASAHNTDGMPASYGRLAVDDASVEISRGAGGSPSAAPDGGSVRLFPARLVHCGRQLKIAVRSTSRFRLAYLF